MKVVAVVLFFFFSNCVADISDCKYSTGGKDYDLSHLKKDYDFKQTVVDSTDNIYTNPDFSNSVNLSFQLGVCKNVDSPKKPCSGESAVFMYDGKKCVGLGSMDVSTFEPNPFQDGVYIDYYNGDMIDHITRYEARVYFVCDKSTTINGPVFEHLKDDYKAHFHVFTKYVC